MALDPIDDSNTAYLVYVSTSGSDANDGFSPLTPKQTLAAAKALIRNGVPDQMFLKRGDTWTEALGAWTTSGPRPSLPQRIGAYGSGARPIVQSGTSHGFSVASTVNYLILEGIDFYGHTYNGSNGTPSGVAWRYGTLGFTITDCKFRNYKIGIELTGLDFPNNQWLRNVKIYRNVIVDCYGTGGAKGHGISAYRIIGGDIYENVIDTIGMVSPSAGQHGIYIPGNGGISNIDLSWGYKVRENLISNCADCGIKNSGGDFGSGPTTKWTLERNVVAKCSVGLWIGDQGVTTSQGVFGEIRYNTILDGLDNDGSNARGWGIVLENVERTSWIYNLIANVGAGTGTHPIIVHPNYPTTLNGRGCYSTTMDRTYIFGWPGTVLINGPSNKMGSNNFGGNGFWDFQAFSQAVVEHVPDNTLPPNTWRCFANHMKSGAASSDQFLVNAVPKTLAQWKVLMNDSSSDDVLPVWPDPTRSIGSYNGTLGGTATHDAFMLEARQQSASNWRPEYTAAAVSSYIRAGFGI